MLPTADALTAELATSPRTTGTLRFRGHDGHWHSFAVTLNLVLLDQHTTAGMITISDPNRS